MSAHNKVQQKTLSVLRSILRLVRETVDSRSASDPGRKDISSFTSHVVGEYRRHALVTNRSEIKALRTTAEDTLAYLKALTEQRDLIIRYRGGDPDSERNRRSAARYVGLEIPTAAPLAPETAPEAFQEKYSSPLATRIGDMSRLTGVDNLKAQLYGMPGSYSEAAGAGAGAYKPLKTESQEPLSLRQAITSGPGPVAPRGVTGTAAQAVAAGAVGAVDAAGEAADGASATKNKGPLR